MSSPTKRPSRKPRARNNNNSGNQQLYAKPKVLYVSVPRQFQLFPPKLRCWGSVNTVAAIPGVSSYDETFKMNGIYLMGPQLSYAGAFSGNTAAGLTYLLSSATAVGSTSPYNYVTVRRVITTIRITSNQGAGSVNVVPGMCFINHNTLASLSGMGQSTIKEQPFTTWKDVPSQTSVPVTIHNDATCNAVMGINENQYLNDEDFWAPALADPTKLCYTHISLRALDGVSNLYYFLDVSFKIEYEFHTLNNFISSVPI